MDIGKIFFWIWLVFFVIVMAKAYYETFTDILAWIKKKIKAREDKKDVDQVI